MTATVDRWDDKLEAINFAHAHSASVGSDSGACDPLVAEALTHMPHTPINPTYYAFQLVAAAK